MTALPLNTGHAFARPYESDYAMWRRALVANPSLSWAGLAHALDPHVAPGRNPTERLAAGQLAPPTTLSLKATYQRQCPVCAQLLYHTDIYALPWLPRCPIHGCELTTTCPTCQESWPSLRDAGARDCPTCGRFDHAARLAAWDAALTSAVERQIGPLVALCTDTSPLGPGSLIDDLEQTWGRYGAGWWVNVPLEAPCFPSVAVHSGRQDDTQMLAHLGVAVGPMERLVSALRSDGDVVPAAWAAGPESSVDWRRDKRMVDHHVLAAIVAWIDRWTPASHQAHTSNYQDRGLTDLTAQPGFCPFCLALSLWVMQVAEQQLGPLCARGNNSFPLFAETGYRGPLEIGAPIAVRHNHQVARLDPSLGLALYRRGLEVAFVDLLRFAFAVAAHGPYVPGDANPLTTAGPDSATARKERWLTLVPMGDELVVLHEPGSVLDRYRPPTTPRPGTRCAAYRKKDAAERLHATHLDVALIPTDLTALELHRVFSVAQRLIRTGLPSRAPWDESTETNQ